MMQIGMRKIIISLLTVCILLFSAFLIIAQNRTITAQPPEGAQLTGNTADCGKDTDGDGKYNCLEVAVEINVSTAGNFRISADYLGDQYGSWLYLSTRNESYLNVGVQWLNLSFYGLAIYAARFNPSRINWIGLYEFSGYSETYLGSISDVRLSRIYNYTEFDCGASLTGRVYDEGKDTDSDGLFNILQIGVEINVTDAATYRVLVDGLTDGVYVSISNSSEAYLSSGIQTLNVSLIGATIYASKGNVSRTSYTYLYVLKEGYQYNLDSKYGCQLNRTYSYKEFDPLAFFTGRILDEGVDEDGDGLYDYLKLSVEINVTDAGRYTIYLYNYLSEFQTYTSEFTEGLYLINFTIYGPKIYAAHINPVYIQDLYLWESSSGGWITLEHRSMIPLPVLYNYSQFESHAFLTGKIYDKGVDADADGLFDYLEVGVEVNVTEAGTYEISVSGLAGMSDNSTQNIYDWHDITVDLSLGVHVVNFTFQGPMIAYYHINPTNVTELRLVESSTYTQLSYIPTVALSKRYNYTQFNSPFNDMQIEFTVYPDATVGVSGLFNYTRMYAPYYYPPLVNATVGFSTSGDLTTGSVNGTMMLPDYPPSFHQFPFNSTTANFASEYDNGMLNAQLNASMLMPPAGSTTYPTNSSDFSFLGTYSDGMLNVDLSGETELPSYFASQLPLNVTDATVLADYLDNKISGNITFHTVSGFPLGDVIVYFNGNKTEISFTGYINVIYGDYFGTTINETVLESMLYNLNSTIPGRGEDSLYNLTQGMIECTELNTTKSPIGAVGARVDYNAIISGNFTEFLAYMLTGPYASEQTRSIVYAAMDSTFSSVNHGSLVLNYYHTSEIASLHLTLSDDVKALWSNALQSLPPNVPTEYKTQCEAWLKIANITAYAVKNAYINIDYSSVEQRLDLHASLTANVTQLKNEIIPILPDAVPAQYKDFVESCTNTTYCLLDSLNTTCNYANGVTDFDAKWLLKGDFTAELNRMKSCYVAFLNLTSPYMINWQTLMLNATEVDISNFKADISLGQDWMTLRFEGLKTHPVKDEIDFVSFKLYNFLNMTSNPSESPREFEKLRITVRGGGNATHTVLLYAPDTIPSPDGFTLNYTSMTWENNTLSSLKDLVFQVAYQGIINHLGKTYYVPVFTNSTVSNFGFNPDLKSISFNVTGATGTGFCDITIPRALLYAALGEWVVKIDGVTLPSENYTVTENAEYVFIHLNYSHSGHLIEIAGTWVITEFQPNMLLIVLAVLSLIAVIIAVKQRKRLNTLKTRYQSALYRFTNKLHQLRT
jgi:hypothetical protein